MSVSKHPYADSLGSVCAVGRMYRPRVALPIELTKQGPVIEISVGDVSVLLLSGHSPLNNYGKEEYESVIRMSLQLM